MMELGYFEYGLIFSAVISGVAIVVVMIFED